MRAAARFRSMSASSPKSASVTGASIPAATPVASPATSPASRTSRRSPLRASSRPPAAETGRGGWPPRRPPRRKPARRLAAEAPFLASARHQVFQESLLRVEAVLGLVPDRRAFPVQEALGDLLARVRRQAVEHDRV